MDFVIGGVIFGAFFITGLYYLNRNKKEKQCTCKTYGKIINHIMHEERESPASDDYRIRRYWHSLCEYTVGATKCVRETNIGTSQPRYEIGQIVTVYYNPNNCHEAYIEGDNNSNIKATLCFALGIIAIIFVYLARKII